MSPCDITSNSKHKWQTLSLQNPEGPKRFFRNLLLGEKWDLRNRFLHINATDDWKTQPPFTNKTSTRQEEDKHRTTTRQAQDKHRTTTRQVTHG